MLYHHIFEPRAQLEYEESVLWYAERSKGVAGDFEAAINKKLVEICSSPKRYRNTRKKFRETHLDKFPFSIIYFINEEQCVVVITSIFHTSRNPAIKYKS